MFKWIIAIILWISLSAAYACSFVKVPYDKGCVIGRTMDFEFNIVLPMVYGASGTKNISNVNSVENLSDSKVKSWEIKYKFIGMAASIDGDVSDGINEEGLYCGLLNLPFITELPEYNKDDSRAVISYLNLSAFFLGTCNSVAQAMHKLQELQVVGSAVISVSIKPFRNLGQVLPVHIILADKSGDSALIEFIGGKIKVHRNGENGNELNVVTNAPSYDWHISDYKKSSADFKAENSDCTWDGLNMNGSGFAGGDKNIGGLAGDWTPPSRFNRATAILQYSPRAETVSQAFYVAEQAINSVCVPLGMNIAVSSWVSMSELREGEYYMKNLQVAATSLKNDINGAIVPDSPHPYTYKEYSVSAFKPQPYPLNIKSEIKRHNVKIEYKKLYKKMLDPKSIVGDKYDTKFIAMPKIK